MTRKEARISSDTKTAAFRKLVSQQQWSSNVDSIVDSNRQDAEEILNQINGRLKRLIQEENNFVNKEITKNVPNR